jgi:hypothetical protein
MPRIEVAGIVCLKRPRPIQSSRADDDDDDDDDDILSCSSRGLNIRTNMQRWP